MGGLLGSIGKVIVGGIAGGPGGAIAVFTVEHGAEVLEGTIDVARQIVRIGTDVYRAIPPEAFVLGGDPIHGLLKHEAEDELIMVGLLAADMAIFTAVTWPAVGPFWCGTQHVRYRPAAVGKATPSTPETTRNGTWPATSSGTPVWTGPTSF